MATRTQPNALKKLLDLTGHALGLAESVEYARLFQQLYNPKPTTFVSDDYDALMAKHKNPPFVVAEFYKSMQKATFDQLISTKQDSLKDFLSRLQVCQYYPGLKVSLLKEHINKLVLENQKVETHQLVEVLQSLSGIYKFNFNLKQDTQILEKIIEKLTPRINTSADLISICFLLTKLRIITNQLIDKIEISAQEVGFKNPNKRLLKSVIALYSRLPQQYYPYRLNSFFMNLLSQYSFSLNEKILLLTSLAKLQSDLNNQLHFISSTTMNSFMQQLYSCDHSTLPVSTKFILINFLRLYSPNRKHSIHIPQNAIDGLLGTLKQAHQSTISSFHLEIEEILKKVNYQSEKQKFVDMHFVDFLIHKGTTKTVLEVDGPSHFWRVNETFLYNRGDMNRSKMWEARGYRFGAVPFYLWNQCKDELTKKVLVRACVQGRSVKDMESILGSASAN